MAQFFHEGRSVARVDSGTKSRAGVTSTSLQAPPQAPPAARRAAIFLDNHSTTRVDPRAASAMQPWLGLSCGNPSSPHAAGRGARGIIDEARSEVAQLLGVEAGEVVFTGGATEANNLAILGALRAMGRAKSGGPRRVVISALEHKSVSEPAAHIERELGYEVVVLPVDSQGRVRIDRATDLLSRGVALVSVQLANSEVGTVQDIAQLASMARANGALFHCDATQGVGRVPFSVRRMGCDMATVASHKIHGPKGIGALAVRTGLTLEPLMYGGKQELGLRPGTENVPAIAGFGEACRIARQEGAQETMRVAALRDELFLLLAAGLPGLRVFGPFTPGPTADVRWQGRTPGNLSIWVGVQGRLVVERLQDKVCLSTGSACNCPNLRSTDTLRAMGWADAVGDQALRLGLSRFTTRDEVREAAPLIIEAVRALRPDPRVLSAPRP